MSQSGLFSILIFERGGSIKSSVKKGLHLHAEGGREKSEEEAGEEGGGGGGASATSG